MSGDDHFGDMGPIVDGYHGRDRDNGFVDEDLAFTVPKAKRHTSNTGNDADPNAEDLQGLARRIWDAMPGGDPCGHVLNALERDTKFDGSHIGEMARLVHLVRLGEQGHPGVHEAAEQWAAQCRSKPRDQHRMIAYALGYVIRDGLTPPKRDDAELAVDEPLGDGFGAEVAAELRRRAVHRAADDAERPPRAPIADGIVWDDDLATIPAPEMAVGELVPERAVGFLGGPSGSYKSFVAAALADGLAYGRLVMGHREFTVRRARKTLIIAGEGASGMALRARAARLRGGQADGKQLGVYPRAVNLTSDRDAAEVLAVCLAEGFEELIVDTFRANTLGVKENDNSEVTIVLGRLIAWRDEHGIGSLLLDHTNKSAQGLADLGGAGAKRANADYVLMVDLPWWSRDVAEQRTLRVAKFKDREDGRTWPIRLRKVPEIVDADGIPTAVVEVGKVAAADDVPDFTPGGWWKAAPPMRDEDVEQLIEKNEGSKRGVEVAQQIWRLLVWLGEADAETSPNGVTLAAIRTMLNECPDIEPRSPSNVRKGAGVLAKAGFAVRDGERVRLPNAKRYEVTPT
jgi:hypothetical protein